MIRYVHLIAWLACVVYSTIPAFWFMVHPFAERWRARQHNPYLVLVPMWVGLWILVAGITAPWRATALYHILPSWIPAVALLALGIWLYARSGKNFSREQLGGFPEVRRHHEQRLVTSGIRARIRHPVYLAHLCEMAAWSIGSGLVVCWCLTAFAVVTGALMIRMEDRELEKRFGEEFRKYKSKTPALFPAPKTPPLEAIRIADEAVQCLVGDKVAWQVPIKDIVCIAEYTTTEGPWADDYFLVLVSRERSYYEASFYADGRDALLSALGERLRSPLKFGLVTATQFKSRIVWPPQIENKPLFVGDAKRAVNPEIGHLISNARSEQTL